MREKLGDSSKDLVQLYWRNSRGRLRIAFVARLDGVSRLHFRLKVGRDSRTGCPPSRSEYVESRGLLDEEPSQISDTAAFKEVVLQGRYYFPLSLRLGRKIKASLPRQVSIPISNTGETHCSYTAS